MELNTRPPPKEDRRSRRTHRLLSDALIALMLEKRYNTITVQEIIDRANVGRSTFYAHYQDKEDLLQTEMARVIAHLDQHMERSHSGDRIVPSYELFLHLQESYRLYTALVRGRAGELIFKIIQTSLREHVLARLASRLPADAVPAVPLLVLANHVAGTLVILMQWWLENQMPYSPEQLEEYFQALIGPSVQAALAPGSAAG